MQDEEIKPKVKDLETRMDAIADQMKEAVASLKALSARLEPPEEK
jgi:hypothetical protein